MAALQHATFQQVEAPAAARLLSPQAQAQPPRSAQPAASVECPALAVRHPEAVYRRRRLVVASLIAAAMTILLAVGRPEHLPGREFPTDGRIGWPALQADGADVRLVGPGDTLRVAGVDDLALE